MVVANGAAHRVPGSTCGRAANAPRVCAAPINISARTLARTKRAARTWWLHPLVGSSRRRRETCAGEGALAHPTRSHRFGARGRVALNVTIEDAYSSGPTEASGPSTPSPYPKTSRPSRSAVGLALELRVGQPGFRVASDDLLFGGCSLRSTCTKPSPSMACPPFRAWLPAYAGGFRRKLAPRCKDKLDLVAATAAPPRPAYEDATHPGCRLRAAHGYNFTRAMCRSSSSDSALVPVTYALAISNRYITPSRPDASQ